MNLTYRVLPNIGIAILGMVILLAEGAFSQQIRFPVGVAQPKQAMQGQSRVNRPWQVWSCNEGAVVRTGPEPDSQPTQEKLAFLQEAYVAYFNKSGEYPNSLLLCETIDGSSFDIKRLIGWVDESDLLLTNVPLPIKKENVEVKSIHRKGMAVISQKSMDVFGKYGVPQYQIVSASTAKSNETRPGENAIIFRASRLQTANDPSTFVANIPLSSFYYVYKDSREFVLVGTNSRFSLTAPADVVLGWLPKVNHAEWSNRIGFEWNVGTFSQVGTESGYRMERGFVFRSYRDVIDFLGSDHPVFTTEEPTGAVFSEKIEKSKPMQMPDSAMRMPLLQYEETDSTSSIAKVGWLGGTGVDEQMRAVNKRRIEELAKQSRNLDVIFLIDHTQTMETHFPVVAEAVHQIVADLRSKYLGEAGIYGRSMRLSISFYGDEEEKDSSAVIRDLQPVTSNTATLFDSLSKQERQAWAKRTDLSANDMLAELPTHPTFGGGGIEEDVLYGILQAVKKFPPDDSRKLVFVIGDMGDKTLLSDEFKHRRDAITRLLANERVPIWFVALQVETAATTANAAGREVAELFQKQMEQIAGETRSKLLSQNASEAELDFSKVVPLNNNSPVDEILRAYSVMQKEIDRYQRGLNNADPSLLTHREIKRLESQNISLDSLRHPLFSEGYIAELARKKAVTDSFFATPQVTRRVLMSRQDLINIKDICDRLLMAIESNSGRDEGIGTLLRKEVAAIYGETELLGSLQETLDLLVNVKLKNDIFKIPYDSLGTASISPKNVEELRASHKRLVDITEGVERVWNVEQDGNKRWRVVEIDAPRKKDRSFTLLHDPFQSRWYWVKESEMP